MGSQHPGEDWSEDDLDMLLGLPLAHVDESRRCHQAGCRLAALVMLAATMESVLLGMVIAQEESLRADGRWPPRPSRMHLSELAGLAKERGWLTHPATDQVVEVLNKARTMAAHPGAYVRGIRQAPELDLRAAEGYQACYQIVMAACEQLSAAAGDYRPGAPAVPGARRPGPGRLLRPVPLRRLSPPQAPRRAPPRAAGPDADEWS